MRISLLGKRVKGNHIGQPGKTDKLPVRPVADGINSPGAQIIPDNFHPAFLPALSKGSLQVSYAIVEEIILLSSAAGMAVCRPVPFFRAHCGLCSLSSRPFPRFFLLHGFQIPSSHIFSHKGKHRPKTGSLTGIDTVKPHGKESVPLRISQPVSAVFPLHMEPPRFPEFFLRPAAIGVPVRKREGRSPLTLLFFRRFRPGKKLLKDSGAFLPVRNLLLPFLLRPLSHIVDQAFFRKLTGRNLLRQKTFRSGKTEGLIS